MSTAEEIARELETFYRHYIEVFNREDDRFFECFASPYASASGGRGLTVVANDAENRIKAWAIAENLGMILSDVTRYKTDGSILEKVRACYMVRRDGDGWKIVTISEIKSPFLGPGDIPR